MSEGLEQQLLQEAQEGDEDSYADLQILLEPSIRRFVSRMIQDDMLVDDLVQDVFIAFYRNLHKIDPPSGLRPYIFRIARNRCYDELRKFQRDNNISMDEEAVQVQVSFTQAHTQPQPDDVTHWILLHLEVQEAMEKLSDSQRTALLLYAEEGMSYAEIAEIEGVSVGTVKSRLYYAKKNLRQYLHPDTLEVILSEFEPTMQN